MPIVTWRMSVSSRSKTSEFIILQDMFDLPLHMARNQIEESLRNKMAFIKVVMKEMCWYICSSFMNMFLCDVIVIRGFSFLCEGADVSATRCTKRCRCHIWSNRERAGAGSSTCWGTEYNTRAGTSFWVLMYPKFKF